MRSCFALSRKLITHQPIHIHCAPSMFQAHDPRHQGPLGPVEGQTVTHQSGQCGGKAGQRAWWGGAAPNSTWGQGKLPAGGDLSLVSNDKQE